MSKTFISYSSNDQLFADRLVDYLESKGIPCWIATRDIPSGADFTECITEAIENCQYFVLIGSESSNISRQVRNEIAMAFDMEKTIIPYKIEDFKFSDSINYYLRLKQYIHAFRYSEKEGLDKLANSILNDIKEIADDRMSYAPALESDLGSDFDRKKICELLIERNKKYPSSLYTKLYKQKEKINEYRALSNTFYKQAFTLKLLNKAIETDDLISELINRIEDCNQEMVFRLQAPAGVGKNHLMQSLFFNMMDRFMNNKSDILPIYIPFDYFTKVNRNDRDSEVSMYTILKNEYIEAINFCLKNQDVTAFIMFDSITNYLISPKPPETCTKRLFSFLPNIKKAMAIDRGPTRNPIRLKKDYVFMEQIPRYIIEANLIFASDKESAMKYLDTVCKLFDYSVTPEDIYEASKELGFGWFDPCICNLIQEEIMGNISDISSLTMADVYENHVLRILDNNKNALVATAKMAYRYMTTTEKFEDEYSNDGWIVIGKHGTFTSFLMAYYLRCELENYSKDRDPECFIRFYPKRVVSFIAMYLEKSNVLQRAIINLIKDNYKERNDSERARLIFWAAYITNPALKTEIDQFVLDELKRITPLVKESNKKNPEEDTEGVRSLQILYRILVQVSLEMGKTTYIDGFLCNLLVSDQANSMNKGYLLFYYNDVPVDFTERSMRFYDHVELGFRTISRLNEVLAAELSSPRNNRPIELFLFSFFSLLQTRIEFGTPELSRVDLVQMARNAIKYFQQYKRRQSVLTSRRTMRYFESMCEDFGLFVQRQRKINFGAEILNPMLNPNLTPRANWCGVKTSRVETVAEHLYGAFLIGMFLLPAQNNDAEGYSKKEILDMLLIHDIGEVRAGDNSTIVNETQKMIDEANEDREMRMLMQKGTYAEIANLSTFYNQWSGFEDKMNVNAKIAHDIDTIHTIYRFLLYYNESKKNFSQEEIEAFVDRRNDIITEIGMKTYQTIILDNELFFDACQELGLEII